MTEREPLTSERLRALTTELTTVLRRHTPEWTAHNDHDPGVTLVELLAWLGDIVSGYQEQVGQEAGLDTRRKLARIRDHVLSDAGLIVSVDDVAWHPPATPSTGSADERTYLVETGADGTTTVRFGDGQTGARPPAGSEVTATYRCGSGAVGLTMTIQWPPEPGTFTVRLSTNALTFDPGPRSGSEWPRTLGRS